MSELLLKLLDGYAKSQKTAVKLLAVHDRMSLSSFGDRISALTDTAAEIALGSVEGDKLVAERLFQQTVAVERTVAFNEHFATAISTPTDPRASRDVGTIGAKLGKLNADVGFQVVKGMPMYAELANRHSFMKPVVQELAKLMTDTLELVSMDRLEEAQFLDKPEGTLAGVRGCLASLRDVDKLYFAVLVKFFKVTYTLGQHQQARQLLAEAGLDAATGLAVIKAEAAGFYEIVDYYRYVAFNLVGARIEWERGTALDAGPPPLAEGYFRVLLNLPNLKIHLYDVQAKQLEALALAQGGPAPFGAMAQGASDGGRYRSRGQGVHPLEDEEEEPVRADKHVSSIDRQEILWLYIVHFLLTVPDLATVVDGANPYFGEEADFLVTNMKTTLSLEITLLSQPGLAHPSTVNIAQMAHRAPDEPKPLAYNRLRAELLAALFVDGTYKEKLKLIVEWVDKYFLGLARSGGLGAFITESEATDAQFRPRFAEQPGKLLCLDGIGAIHRRLVHHYHDFLNGFSANGPTKQEEKTDEEPIWVPSNQDHQRVRAEITKLQPYVAKVVYTNT